MAQQWPKSSFAVLINCILQLSISWKRFENTDDSSCTQGRILSLHPIKFFLENCLSRFDDNLSTQWGQYVKLIQCHTATSKTLLIIIISLHQHKIKVSSKKLNLTHNSDLRRQTIRKKIFHESQSDVRFSLISAELDELTHVTFCFLALLNFFIFKNMHQWTQRVCGLERNSFFDCAVAEICHIHWTRKMKRAKDGVPHTERLRLEKWFRSVETFVCGACVWQSSRAYIQGMAHSPSSGL